jgi:hypothetical protein
MEFLTRYNLDMELTLTTPALLFPAISLLMLAYTQRFLHLAALMRELYNRYKSDPDPKILGQINNLKYRLRIIRNEQVFGAASFFLSAVSMFLIFINQPGAAKWVFGMGLLLLIFSLALSLREVQVSIEALRLEVEDIETE